VQCYGGGGNTANMATGQAANGPTNVIDRGNSIGPAVIRIATTAGATPTATYLVEGSLDGTNFTPATIADSATPTTLSFATFTITSTTTTTKYLQANQPFRYIRVTISAITNVTSTIDFFAAGS
jgi:hypothetical protein